MSAPVTADLPPLVYAPCHPSSSAAGPEVSPGPDVVVRRTRDGRTAVVVYTALDRLRDACGTGHPWRLLTVDDLRRLKEEVGYDVLYLDLVMPPEERVAGPDAPAEELPPVLYVPCARHVTRLEDAVVEYLRGEDGGVGLPAYTSLDRLRSGVGAGQPWIVVETARLDHLHRLAPYDRVLLDERLTVTGTEGAWG